jgi:hypothetical protein
MNHPRRGTSRLSGFKGVLRGCCQSGFGTLCSVLTRQVWHRNKTICFGFAVSQDCYGMSEVWSSPETRQNITKENRRTRGAIVQIFCLMYLCSASHVESAIVERGEKASMDKSRDQDRGKGAMEQDQQNQGGNTSMQGQLGHRDENAELKNADADLSG